MKQKVIDILNNRISEINQNEFTYYGVMEENFELLAEDIIKLFAISNVSNLVCGWTNDGYRPPCYMNKEMKCEDCIHVKQTCC